MKYSKLTIEKIADFKNDTKGIWFGRFVDIFGGRAVVKITIQY
ncbi:putative RiPP precursor [Eubacteriales bacterium KG127]